LTPDGRISAYFFGVEYPPSNVRLGLVMRPRQDRDAGRSLSIVFATNMNPTKARYSATILTVIRMGGVVTLFCIAIRLLYFPRREHRAGAAGNSARICRSKEHIRTVQSPLAILSRAGLQFRGKCGCPVLLYSRHRDLLHRAGVAAGYICGLPLPAEKRSDIGAEIHGNTALESGGP